MSANQILPTLIADLKAVIDSKAELHSVSIYQRDLTDDEWADMLKGPLVGTEGWIATTDAVFMIRNGETTLVSRTTPGQLDDPSAHPTLWAELALNADISLNVRRVGDRLRAWRLVEGDPVPEPGWESLAQNEPVIRFKERLASTQGKSVLLYHTFWRLEERSKGSPPCKVPQPWLSRLTGWED